MITGLCFVNPNSFYESLKDGVLLCELYLQLFDPFNTTNLRFYSFLTTKLSPSQERDNISSFITALKERSMKCEWNVDALHSKKDLDSVLETLSNLKKQFEKKFGNVTSDDEEEDEDYEESDEDDDEEEFQDDSCQSVEYNIMALKDQMKNPFPEQVQHLRELLLHKPLTWCQNFTSEQSSCEGGGMRYLCEIISALSKKSYPSDSECKTMQFSIECCRVLVKRGIVEPFEIVKSILSLLIQLCHSKKEHHVRAVLQSLESNMKEHDEPFRFFRLMEWLKQSDIGQSEYVQGEICLKTLILLHSLIHSSHVYVQSLVRDELEETHLETVLEELEDRFPKNQRLQEYIQQCLEAL
ncbi:hypothetical protein C9374_002070 [Naegleria lovaniensis]|uniref:Calponin-homology (CH) domain-containing protein n=1 Tax=Naegleria lovaniensis TaxID=51637 RepID=A0AA88GQH8_NAELO|nr:uncharacterized protein C9374_002070 [Naegleria lovaniensis]KAG2387035.1 hypothetical protein C9374_002070 [Naegleria lovaniensis]